MKSEQSRSYILLELLKRLIENKEVPRRDFKKEFKLTDKRMGSYLFYLRSLGVNIGNTKRINGNMYLISTENLHTVVEKLKKSTLKKQKNEEIEINVANTSPLEKFSFENIKNVFITLEFEKENRKVVLNKIDRILKPQTLIEKAAIIKTYNFLRSNYMRAKVL